MYKVQINKNAEKHIEFHNRSGNLSVMRKIKTLLEELREHPYTGTGKPEQLKHDRAGQWSRRINNEHRLVYLIEENVVKIVNILSAKGHY